MRSSSAAFRAWRERMNMTHREAARALGLGITTVSNYSIGKRCDTEDDVVVPKCVLLACAAVERGLLSIS